MPDETNLDETYLSARKATREWQQTQTALADLLVAEGGAGTSASPAETLSIEVPKETTRGPTTSLRTSPQAGEGETLAPQDQTLATGALGEAMKALGGKGKALGEALHPGVVAAGRAVGLDETQANVVATGLVNLVGGLPGPEESGVGAGVATALAGVPLVGMAVKGAKGAGKVAGLAQKLQPTWEEAVRLDDADRAMQAGFKSFQKKLSTQRRAVRTDVQVGEEATRLSQERLSWEAILQLPPGTIANDAQLVAIKGVFKEKAEATRQLAKWYLEHPEAPDRPDALIQLLTQMRQIGDGVTNVAGVYAEPGRTVRLMHRDLPTTGAVTPPTPERVRIQDPYLQQWLAFFQKQHERATLDLPHLSPEKLATALAMMKTPEDFARIATILDKPTKWDMFLEYWINGLLSGPQTQAVNAMSNAATLAWGMPERAVAAMFSREVRPTEATAMLRGIIEAQGDALRLAWKAFKTETPQFSPDLGGKLELPRRSITADALEWTGIPGRAIDYLGVAIRLSGRELMAVDEYFKVIAFRAEVRALATREAFREAQLLNISGKPYRQKFAEIEQRILRDPPDSIVDAAKEFAAYTTFTRELGDFGQAVQHLTNQKLGNVPVGKFVLPFMRAATNLFKYAGERTPLALASKAVREELAAGGDRRALALAKMSLGTMIMVYAGTKASEGVITGNGPKDNRLRQIKMMTGWKPCSLHMGGEYYSLARFDPFSTLICGAADAVDLMGQLGTKDADELAAGLVVAISRNVSNKTFLKGIVGTMNAVASNDINVVKAFFEKELPTILPFSTALGQSAHIHDPVMREVNSLLDAFKAKIPGYSSTLPPSRNLWGDPILLEGGVGPDIISPIYTSTEKLDPVAEELATQEMPIGMPSKEINDVPLKPWEYDAYVRLAGGMPILAGLTLKQRLAEVMKLDAQGHAHGFHYAQATKEGKLALVEDWVNKYREQARTIMSQPDLSQHWLKTTFPDLHQQIEMKRQATRERFTGQKPQLHISP